MSHFKYQRTPHLPFSPGATSDDKKLRDTAHLEGQEVICSVKYDGENSNLYSDGFHARSLDGRHHPSRDWLKAFHGNIAHRIPAGWRICGENLFARHSLAYVDLPSYFLGFSAWDETNTTLGWDFTLDFFAEVGVLPVDVLYRGPFSDKVMRELAASMDTSKQEGFVCQLAEPFHYDDFHKSVAKWVRQNHVQTTEHWMHGPIVPNGLI